MGWRPWQKLTLSKFCDDAELLIGLKRVKHLDDVLVLQAPQDFNLLSQADDVPLALAMLQNEFHGHSLARPSPPTFVHLQLLMAVKSLSSAV